METVAPEVVDDLKEGRAVVSANVTLLDGTRITVPPTRIVQGRMSWQKASSSSGSLDVGGAYMGTCTITLRNEDRYFDQYDLSYAKVVPQVDNQVRSYANYLIGVYYAEPVKAYGDLIPLTCCDVMGEMGKWTVYDTITSPQQARWGLRFERFESVRKLAKWIAASMGIAFAGCPARCDRIQPFMTNDEMIVLSDTPEHIWEDWGREFAVPQSFLDATMLEAVAWLAEACGCFAVITRDGQLQLREYDINAFDMEDEYNLDGGTFNTGTTPYSDGDTADGGDFYVWTFYGHAYDGGLFGDYAYATVGDPASVKADLRDITVTGVMVTACDEYVIVEGGDITTGILGAKGETATVLTDGRTTVEVPGDYVLSVDGNPIIGYGREQSFAGDLAQVFLGLTMRPFEVTCPADPTIEVGDAVLVSDRHGIAYRGYATQITMSTSGKMHITCGAASESTPYPKQIRRSQRQQHVDIALSDLRTTVSQVANGSGNLGVGGSGSGGGSGWIVQVNGVTLRTGTLNFITE